MRLLTYAVAIAATVAASAAWAQTWKAYAFPEAGFSIQFPARPVPGESTFHAGALSAPARTWSVVDDGVSYEVTVADFGREANGEQLIAAAIAALKQTGEIKVDTSERIDRAYGHDITLDGKDGSRSAIAVFFVDGRLYQLIGKAPPARFSLASSRTARFQQTLVFIDSAGRAPRRPDDGLGGGEGAGRGPPGPGRRGPPPPQAFADCRDHKEGDQVRHTTPDGQTLDAACVSTPQGLAARPNPPGF